MKFNPTSNELFTDNGQLIKRLHCPFRIRWDNLKQVEGEDAVRLCSECDHNIIDTALYDDGVLLNLLRKQPDTCLKINLNQNNLKIITDGILEQK